MWFDVAIPGRGVGYGPEKLPPSRVVLVVDPKEFGGHSGRGPAVLSDAIPDVLALAFERAGLAPRVAGAMAEKAPFRSWSGARARASLTKSSSFPDSLRARRWLVGSP